MQVDFKGCSMSDSLNETIQDTIQDFVVTAINDSTNYPGAKVIWLEPNIRRPSLPYVGLKIISGPRKTGPAEIRHTGTQDQFRRPFRKQITLSVTVYAGDQWLNVIQTIMDALELEAGLQVLRAGGIAVHGSSDPIDLSELLNDSFEGRGTVDLFLAYNQDIIEETGQIEKVTFTGEVNSLEIGQTIP